MEKKFNQENYQFLSETLAALGFENYLNGALRTKMELGLDNFTLSIDKSKNETEYTRYTVSFERGKKEEYQNRIFLNRIKASNRLTNGEILATSEFKVFKKNGFNVDEMRDLLESRPVFREKNLQGEKDPKWYRVDVSNPNEEGIAPIVSYPENVARINVGRELDKLNIVWKNGYEKGDAILDLQAGKRIYATARQNGRLEGIGIEVSPQINPGLAVLNKEGEVIKFTNSQSQAMKVVEEDGVVQNNQQNNTQSTGFKVVDVEQGNGKITETTKQVMEAANNPERQSRGNRQKAS